MKSNDCLQNILKSRESAEKQSINGTRTKKTGKLSSILNVLN